MTKSDYVEWKSHPVTREIFSVWRERHDNLLEEIVYMEPDNPRMQQTLAAVKVYREILNMEGPE